MQIQDIFERRIARAINGVVKADQRDDASVWQELDEFVVTRELNGHMAKFLEAFASTLGRSTDTDATSKTGVWISGFFGSGKSHFIKVLSYLLKNELHRYDGQQRKAAEFFESKVQDAMILGDIRRVSTTHTDAILFNIDSKADTNNGRDAILRVFLKVFNEMQGFCADHPEIAYMERHLQKKGKLSEFKEAFRRHADGAEWVQERDAYHFNRDQAVASLSEVLGQSQESAARFVDGGAEGFSITPENFSKWVKEYLDEKGPQHRIMFLVDEVGQFIGSDSHLMLSLQTITENLGTICDGRAWVVVTSQEDIDAVLGQLKKEKAQDFSKIQGRFKTRLSLSSTNVDEVILKRLLAKKDAAKGALREIFKAKGDILKHQMSFLNTGMTFRHYKEAEDFAAHYPFAPYQFQLIQKIFEAIRKHGATGAHLSRGERSILDAFQSAAKQVAERELGVLVPLYRFYPSIESFLDTAVKRTIDQAKDNPSLQEFDVLLLQVLFLIRYVEEMKANVDNLASLCADEIDQDRIPLKRRIEESLARLEKETLISRNGDLYFFLTNEERDINREIKNVDVIGSEEATALGELVFKEVYKDNRKFTHLQTRRPFTFNRECDQHAIGHKADGGLPVLVITPLADDYDTWDKGRCLAESSARDGGAVVIRLGDHPTLQRELRMMLQVDRYNSQKNDGAQPAATVRILQDLAAENRNRRERLVDIVANLLKEADYFVAGQPLAPKKGGAQDYLMEALGYLVDNTFSKMSYIRKRGEGDSSQVVLREIQAVLRANDVAKARLDLEEEESNPQAIKEVREYLNLMGMKSAQVVLHDLVETKFTRRPYGWPEEEILLIVVRLLALGEVHLVMDGAPLANEKVFEAITNAQKRRKITLVQRKAVDPKAIQAARQLGKDVFAQMGPDGEDPIVVFLRGKLEGWQEDLKRYQGLCEASTYPGRDKVESLLKLLKPLASEKDGAIFLEAFNDAKDALLDASDEFHTLSTFFASQRPAWDRMRITFKTFDGNRLQIEEDESGKTALRRLEEILQMSHPYNHIQEGSGLIEKLEGIQSLLVAQHRQQTKSRIEGLLATLRQDSERLHVSSSTFESCVASLKALQERVDRQESIPHLKQAIEEADHLYGEALHRLEKAYLPPASEIPSGGGSKERPEPVKPVIKKTRIVKPAELAPKAVLENQEDVEAFLIALRVQLESALANHERIQIR